MSDLSVISAVLLCLAAVPESPAAEYLVTDFGAVAGDTTLDTRGIQAAIDTCASDGGGTVRFPRGEYRCGALKLKDYRNITLLLDSGTVLRGSSRWEDYGDGAWGNALLSGDYLSDITIQGKATIDGVDCENPNGEEGFRGPHVILFSHASGITIKDVTITHAGNYAMLCYYGKDWLIENVSVRGGHDGLHAQICSSYTVTGCDFQAGDDAFAGCDNRDITVTDCQINSSCNGFRFGCDGLTVRGCHFYGPGRYWHKVSQRKNMISAFVHFAPKDRNPTIPSDNWLIEDCTVDSVDYLYYYDFHEGLWQGGQPVKTIRMKNVTATRLLRDCYIVGDSLHRFRLLLEDVDLNFRTDSWDWRQMHFDISSFGTVSMRNVVLRNRGADPVLVCADGDTLVRECVEYVPETNANPYSIQDVQFAPVAVACSATTQAMTPEHPVAGQRTEMVEIVSINGRVVARHPLGGRLTGEILTTAGRGVYLIRFQDSKHAVGRLVVNVAR